MALGFNDWLMIKLPRALWGRRAFSGQFVCLPAPGLGLANGINLRAGEYSETFEGKTIDARGVKARHVRLYSKGNTDSSLNEYTEVEIYGRPLK
jgi:hypothetical protein